MNDGDTTKPTAVTDAEDWSRFDDMSEEQRHAAAMADPDAQPLSDTNMGKMKMTPRVKIIRRALRLSVADFSARFRIPVDLIEDWEARRATPDATARAYLIVIATSPDAVRHALDQAA